MESTFGPPPMVNISRCFNFHYLYYSWQRIQVEQMENKNSQALQPGSRERLPGQDRKSTISNAYERLDCRDLQNVSSSSSSPRQTCRLHDIIYHVSSPSSLKFLHRLHHVRYLASFLLLWWILWFVWLSGSWNIVSSRRIRSLLKFL